MTDTQTTIQQQGGNKIVAWLLANFWRILSGLLFLGIVVVYTRPFSNEHTDIESDMAKAWNTTIQRLGLQPLYPPQENFSVGDIWIVASSVASGNGQYATAIDANTLQQHAVRVGHVDLTQSIQNNQFVPSLSSTAVADDGTGKTELVPAATSSDGSVHLTMLSYPGLHISRKAGASASFLGGLFSSSRQEDQIQDIAIPVAETYGALPLDAMGALYAWCASDDNKPYCEDEDARNYFAYAVNPAVLAVTDQKYSVRLELIIVDRVYTTRQLDITSVGNITKDIKHGADKDPGKQDGKSASEAALSNDVESSLTLKKKFPRPMVFGFRSVGFGLAPSDPSKGTAAK
ncbi:hypothetical protein [Mesorhizobium australicum]|uniref:hypothetical protein n=1 Tax=Mesorhizobium australicum TaxID=536018 RepID=UPI0033378AF5